VAAGSFQDEIWAFMLRNAAVTADAQMYKSTSIDPEQLASWDPAYLFFYNSPEPETIVDGGIWSELSAVKNGRVFAVPTGPWGYSYPPSVNRYLAVLWLSEVVYPGAFHWDARSLTKEYYALFYRYALSDAEYEALFFGESE
jgi:iron complex transport system substrate-binding protein